MSDLAALMRRAVAWPMHTNVYGQFCSDCRWEVVDPSLASEHSSDCSRVTLNALLLEGAAQLERIEDLKLKINAWCRDDDQTDAIPFICETIRPALGMPESFDDDRPAAPDVRGTGAKETP